MQQKFSLDVRHVVCCDILANTTLSEMYATVRSAIAIVCDYMETTLFAIVCDLRSPAIIWKPALNGNLHITCIEPEKSKH